MADEAQDKTEAAKSTTERAQQNDDETTKPPRAANTENVNLEEAKAREADAIKAAEEKGLPPVFNGPEEDPYKGIDPQFIY